MVFCAMVQFIKEKHSIPRVSVERVASGSGLVNVYEFLCLKYPERVDNAVDAGESFSPRTYWCTPALTVNIFVNADQQTSMF